MVYALRLIQGRMLLARQLPTVPGLQFRRKSANSAVHDTAAPVLKLQDATGYGKPGIHRDVEQKQAYALIFKYRKINFAQGGPFLILGHI